MRWYPDGVRGILVVCLLFSACNKKSASEEPAAQNQASANSATRPSPATDSPPIAWIENDYAIALASARAQEAPLFVELWAPWCHVCLHQKQTVLRSDLVRAKADAFVWLSVDREQAAGAALMAKFPVPVSPAYYLVDPRDESILTRQIGASDLDQLVAFLDAGLSLYRESKSEADGDKAQRLFRAADQAAARGENKIADQNYSMALKAAPKGWPRLPDLVVAALSNRRSMSDFAGCANTAIEYLQACQTSVTALGTASYLAEMCAREVDEALATKLRTLIVGAVDAVDVTAEDSVLEYFEARQMRRYAYVGLGNEQAALDSATREEALLKSALAAASTPNDRLALWIASSEVFYFLGHSDELIAMLRAAIVQHAEYYHLHFLLAQVLFLEDNFELALASAEAARRLVYGPQEGVVLELLADIHQSKGDLVVAASLRSDALDFYSSLPAGHKQEDAIERARRALRVIP